MTNNKVNPKNFTYEVKNLNTQQKQDLGAELRSLLSSLRAFCAVYDNYNTSKPVKPLDMYYVMAGTTGLIAPQLEKTELLVMQIEHDLQTELQASQKDL